MSVEFFDCLQDGISFVGKNEELTRQKEVAEKNSHDLTSELEKVRKELEMAKGAAQLKGQKRKECEEALAQKEDELAEVVDLYRLPTLVMAFTDCRKKVKVQNPEVDVRNITFGPEEAGGRGEWRQPDSRIPARDKMDEAEASKEAEVAENVQTEVDQPHEIND
ncbi:hypothetical protein SLEP1_g29620 [Rubroshorea leprosula]|uniref:Uncharacterized protein n=1 Tax=Rubroshorea leprosula TaxID=152421 RepID=A0AAV5K6G3_9ROSI|nr:hypothetical protein SLEP1_g29620 [Rubroshorea leprosula]